MTSPSSNLAESDEHANERIHRLRWWTLTILCLSLVLVVVGNTVVNVALPALSRDLGASNTDLQWIVDGYSLVFAGLLLVTGALGDRFGRKGALTIGLLTFAIASIWATVAPTSGHLIAARCLMGLGGAFAMPATLSILTNVFPPEERAKAIGIWSGLAGAGGAFGPIASGWLLEHFWWGSVFLLNLPVVAVALIGGHFLIPTSRDPDATPLDPLGAVLSIAGIGSLLYAIIEGPIKGWGSTTTLTWFAIAAVLVIAFGYWETRCRYPMLDLELFKSRSFSVGSGAIMLTFFAMFGMFFLLTQYLQLVLGYGPFESGIRFLPVAFGMGISAPISASMAGRFGARVIVSSGLAMMSLSLIALSTIDAATDYSLIAGIFVFMSVGMGMIMAPATNSIMGSIPLNKAGVGSAVNDTTRELGGALGVAIIGSLAAARFSKGIGDLDLPPAAAEAAKHSLGAATGVAAQIRETVGAGPAKVILDGAHAAFVDGMGLGMTVAAGIGIVAAIATALWLPDRPTLFDEVPPLDDAEAADDDQLSKAGIATKE